MADTTTTSAPASGALGSLLSMLWRDKFATISLVFLIFIAVLALVGPTFIGDLATKVALRQRNMAPGSLDQNLPAQSVGRLRDDILLLP